MRRIALAAAFVFSAAAIAAGSAGSATSRSTFQVSVAETTSAASNGLTLNTEVAGMFNVEPSVFPRNSVPLSTRLFLTVSLAETWLRSRSPLTVTPSKVAVPPV